MRHARANEYAVVALDDIEPFTAACARNAGFEFVVETWPEIRYVQFLDGDCVLDADWLWEGRRALELDERLGLVTGLLREFDRNASVYHRLCDREWDGPLGFIRKCGGNSMVRASAYRSAGGMCSSLIAGEEAEFQMRLQSEGWKMKRIARRMAQHDADMKSFGQWWTRSLRYGHVCAEGALLAEHRNQHYKRREARSNWVWGMGLPLTAAALAPVTLGASILLAGGAYGALYGKVYRLERAGGRSRRDAEEYARYTVLGKVPHALGQARFHAGRLAGKTIALYEYKKNASSTRSLPSDDFAMRSKPPMRRRVLRSLERGIHASGLHTSYVPPAAGRGVAILAYHAVPSPDIARWLDPQNRIDRGLFERQMHYLAKHRRVLDLDEVLSIVEGRSEAPPGAVALTFDDGYVDHAHFVAPLLDSLGLPAAFYLPTSLMRREETPWPDRLYAAFRYRTRDRLALPTLRKDPYLLNRQEERREAYAALTARLIEAGLDERRVLLAQAVEALDPSETPPRLLMTFAEAREMRRLFPRMRLGIHGAEHLDMTAQSDAVVEQEFTRSMQEFQASMDAPGLDFAYPYSRADDRTRAIAETCGVRSAMLGGMNVAFPLQADALTLPRIDAPPDLGLLGYLTSGAYPLLSEALRSVPARVGRSFRPPVIEPASRDAAE